MKRRLIVMMGALLAAGCVLAYAESATLDVDFPFEAGGKPFADLSVQEFCLEEKIY